MAGRSPPLRGRRCSPAWGWDGPRVFVGTSLGTEELSLVLSHWAQPLPRLGLPARGGNSAPLSPAAHSAPSPFPTPQKFFGAKYYGEGEEEKPQFEEEEGVDGRWMGEGRGAGRVRGGQWGGTIQDTLGPVMSGSCPHPAQTSWAGHFSPHPHAAGRRWFDLHIYICK